MTRSETHETHDKHIPLFVFQQSATTTLVLWSPWHNFLVGTTFMLGSWLAATVQNWKIEACSYLGSTMDDVSAFDVLDWQRFGRIQKLIWSWDTLGKWFTPWGQSWSYDTCDQFPSTHSIQTISKHLEIKKIVYSLSLISVIIFPISHLLQSRDGSIKTT
jgi:hypothetical protein